MDPVFAKAALIVLFLLPFASVLVLGASLNLKSFLDGGEDRDTKGKMAGTLGAFARSINLCGVIKRTKND